MCFFLGSHRFERSDQLSKGAPWKAPCNAPPSMSARGAQNPGWPWGMPGRQQRGPRAAGRVPRYADRELLLYRGGALAHEPRGEMMRDKLTHKSSPVASALLVAASVGLAGCGDHVGNKQAAVL